MQSAVADPDSISTTYIGSSTAADSYSLVRTIEVSLDGQYIFVTSRSPEMIRQFSVTDPLDITQGVTEIASVSHGQSDPRFLRFSPDGTKLFFGITSIVRWDLTTPWDITTGAFIHSLNVGLSYGGCFSEDGTRLFTCRDSGILEQWNLATAWDLTTAVKQAATLSPSGEDFLFFDEGKIGVALFSDPTTGHYDIYKLSTPYELSTAVLSETKDFSGGLSAKGSLALAKAKNIDRIYNGIMNQGSYEFIEL